MYNFPASGPDLQEKGEDRVAETEKYSSFNSQGKRERERGPGRKWEIQEERESEIHKERERERER